MGENYYVQHTQASKSAFRKAYSQRAENEKSYLRSLQAVQHLSRLSDRRRVNQQVSQQPLSHESWPISGLPLENCFQSSYRNFYRKQISGNSHTDHDRSSVPSRAFVAAVTSDCRINASPTSMAWTLCASSIMASARL